MIPLEKTLGNLYAVLEFYNGLEVCVIFFFNHSKDHRHHCALWSEFCSRFTMQGFL